MKLQNGSFIIVNILDSKLLFKMMVALFGSFQSNIFLTLFSFIYLTIYTPFNFVPPGTTKIKGVDFYVDKTEVTNKDWAEYILFIKNHYGINSNEYKEALPDSSVWYSVYSGKIMSFHNPFADYPVVGISYEQAVQYCKWRSKQVNEKYKKHNTTYKLPSEQEWEKIYEHVNKREYHDTLYHYKNIKKIRGICDNVSEMTDKPNIAKGGDWTNKEQCNAIIKYNSPQNWLGFRCIAYCQKKSVLSN